MKTATSPFPLILASTSPYRRALLGRLGVDFAVRKPPFDEDSLKNQGLPPLHLAQTLAREKALSAQQNSSEVLVGSDQLVSFEARPGEFQILGKPKTRERNIEQLQQLSGNTHQLITAVCVLQGTQRFEFHDITRIQLRSLSRAEIESCVDLDQAFDCAGGYKFEKAGIRLIEKLECGDPSAIEGLPLIQLSTILHQLGYF